MTENEDGKKDSGALPQLFGGVSLTTDMRLGASEIVSTGVAQIHAILRAGEGKLVREIAKIRDKIPKDREAAEAAVRDRILHICEKLRLKVQEVLAEAKFDVDVETVVVIDSDTCKATASLVVTNSGGKGCYGSTASVSNTSRVFGMTAKEIAAFEAVDESAKHLSTLQEELVRVKRNIQDIPFHRDVMVGNLSRAALGLTTNGKALLEKLDAGVAAAIRSCGIPVLDAEIKAVGKAGGKRAD